MTITTTGVNGYQAAAEFAATAFDEPRTVHPSCGVKGGSLRFRLVGGTRWYRVTMRPDCSGWDVRPE